MYYIVFLKNLMRIHKLLFVVDGDLFFITPILHPILSILALLLYQALLVSLLRIIGSINSCGIVSNSTQLLKINTGIRKSLGNVIVKDIKGIPLFRPRLLRNLKACNKTT